MNSSLGSTLIMIDSHLFPVFFFSLSTSDHLGSVIARLHIIVSLSLGHSQAPRDKRRTPAMTLNHTPFICGNDIKN